MSYSSSESASISPCKAMELHPELQHYYVLHNYNSRRKYWTPLIPTSNKYCFIIGLEPNTLRYLCPSFKSEVTDNHITEQEVKSFVRKLSRKSAPELLSLQSGRRIMRVFLFLVPTFLFLGLFLILYGLNQRTVGLSQINGAEVVKASYALIIGFVLCIIALIGGVLIFSFCLALLIGNAQELLVEKIVDHIIEENLRWKKRGIQWVVGPRGWWIEMWLEYKFSNSSPENLCLSPQSTADTHYGTFENSAILPNSGGRH